MVKHRTLMPLFAATARRVSWSHVVAPCAVAIAIVAVADRSQPGQPDLVVLRWAALLLVVALASALEDPCETDLAAAPTSIAATRTAAFALATLPVAAAWTCMLLLPPTALPWVALTAELVALLLLGTATAGLAQRLQLPAPAGLIGLVPGAAVLLVAPLLRREVALFASPTDPVAWELAHDRWFLLAMIGVVITLVSGLDRGRRSLHRTLSPARSSPPPRPWQATRLETVTCQETPAQPYRHPES